MSNFTFIKQSSNVDSSMFSLANEPVASVHENLVYINAKGELHVIPSGQQLSRKVKKANRYHAVYSVSKEAHVYQHTGEYESSDIGQYFQISITLKLSVGDPIQYVISDEHEVYDLLEPKFRNAMRKYAKYYSILDHKNAIGSFDEVMERMGIAEELENFGLKVKLNDYTIDLTTDSKNYYNLMFKMVRDKEIKIKQDQIDIETRHESERLQAAMQESRTKEIINNYIINLQSDGYVLATAKLQQISPELYSLMYSNWEQEKDEVKQLVQSGISVEDAKSIVKEKQLALGQGQATPIAVNSVREKPKKSLGEFFAGNIDDMEDQR
ncbi:hypothetical protein SY83_09405 [Paenibacillus swuensis]|uniref:Uncharacterized protein n=1 Tax=Paenibacillus swuensis TaxID=1178515 RepID=A0A172THC6_9BACL|nr:hypothetical protein [Paenibacillus swuensis]ANE46455.1 hypothetical protein SY83_09405 [Paenibacillus swuensis]